MRFNLYLLVLSIGLVIAVSQAQASPSGGGHSGHSSRGASHGSAGHTSTASPIGSFSRGVNHAKGKASVTGFPHASLQTGTGSTGRAVHFAHAYNSPN